MDTSLVELVASSFIYIQQKILYLLRKLSTILANIIR